MATKDFIGLGVFFVIIVASFSQFYYLSFGDRIQKYSSYVKSLMHVILFLLVHPNEMTDVSPFMGPILYMSYMFTMLAVFVNLFFALVDDAFRTVRHQRDIILLDNDTGRHFKSKAYQFVTQFKKLLNGEKESSDEEQRVAATKAKTAFDLMPSKFNQIIGKVNQVSVFLIL
jgi:hypothetical protein